MLADRSRRDTIPVQPASLDELTALLPDALPADPATEVDPPWATNAVGALEYVRESLDARVTARRREMVEELVAARTEAATRVRAAQREAAAIVHAAGAELIAALLNGAAHPGPSDAPRTASAEAVLTVEPTQTPTPIAHVDHPAVTPSLPLAPPRPRPVGLRRLVHLDTVLPLVAVLILLVVLVAWIG